MTQQKDAPAIHDNPHAHSPIPEYAKKWHSTVYRPKRLPQVYETRVDSAQIFALPYNPDTKEKGEYFIVAQRCTQCARVRTVCSRGDPACRRCVEKELSCVPAESGYVELPLPRAKRQLLRQEVQALKNSLPDAPYYRDHSASVAKSLTLPAESAPASAQRKGKPSLEQESVSSVQKKRKESQGQGKANVAKRNSKKRASESPQPEPAAEDEPAGEVVLKTPHPTHPTPSTTPSMHSPTPASSSSEPRHPSVFTRPLDVMYVTTSRPNSLSMVTNGTHTLVGAVPDRSPSPRRAVTPNGDASPAHRADATNNAVHPPALHPSASASSKPNGATHSQSPRPATASVATSVVVHDPSPFAPPVTVPTSVAPPPAAAPPVPSPPAVASPYVASQPATVSSSMAFSPAAMPSTLTSALAVLPPSVAYSPVAVPSTVAPPPTAVPSPPTAVPSSVASQPTNGASQRLSIRLPPRSSLYSATAQAADSTAQKAPSSVASKSPPGAAKPLLSFSDARSISQRPVGAPPMRTIYDVLNTTANASPPSSEAVRPTPTDVAHPARAGARPAPTSSSATPANNGQSQLVPQGTQSTSYAQTVPRTATAAAEDQSCSFRLSTSAAWLAEASSSSSESSNDEPLRDVRKRKHAQEASASAGSRSATKRKRPAAAVETHGPDIRKPPPTPWWAAQASVTNGWSWYGHMNGMVTRASAVGGGSASTSIAPLNEAPFLSPLHPPLPSIQKRAERFAPLHESPPIDTDCDSEEEVAQYLKPRPRKNGRAAAARSSPARSPAPTFVPRQKLLADSAVVMIEDTLMQLPRSRLIQMSEYFAKHLARDGDADEQSSVMDQSPVVKVTGVCAEDLVTLLGVCDDPSIFIQRQPPFRTLIAVFCAARSLRFRQIDALATSRLESLWQSDLHKLSPVRSPHAAETVVIARMYNLPVVLKRAFYELLRSEGFAQQGVEDAGLSEGALLDGSRLIGRAKLSHSDMVRLVTTREKLQMAWTLLAGTAPSPSAFPCMLQQTTSANAAYSTHEARERCATACKKSAQIWAEWVLDSGLFESWMYDPVCGLERLSVLDWENSGFCSSCVMTRRQLWARKREEIWDNLDTWLGL